MCSEAFYLCPQLPWYTAPDTTFPVEYVIKIYFLNKYDRIISNPYQAALEYDTNLVEALFATNLVLEISASLEISDRVIFIKLNPWWSSSFARSIPLGRDSEMNTEGHPLHTEPESGPGVVLIIFLSLALLSHEYLQGWPSWMERQDGLWN